MLANCQHNIFFFHFQRRNLPPAPHAQEASIRRTTRSGNQSHGGDENARGRRYQAGAASLRRRIKYSTSRRTPKACFYGNFQLGRVIPILEKLLLIHIVNL